MAKLRRRMTSGIEFFDRGGTVETCRRDRFPEALAAVGQVHAPAGAGRVAVFAHDRVQDLLVFPVFPVEIVGRRFL